jgi:hypothetical protein
LALWSFLRDDEGGAIIFLKFIEDRKNYSLETEAGIGNLNFTRRNSVPIKVVKFAIKTNFPPSLFSVFLALSLRWFCVPRSEIKKTWQSNKSLRQIRKRRERERKKGVQIELLQWMLSGIERGWKSMWICGGGPSARRRGGGIET